MTLEEERLERIFKALGSRSRLRILQTLLTKGEMSVLELSEMLKASYKGISRNLLLLNHAGFLSMRAKGNYVYYSIRNHNVHKDNLLLIALLKSAMAKARGKTKVADFISAAVFDPRMKKILEIFNS